MILLEAAVEALRVDTCPMPHDACEALSLVQGLPTRAFGGSERKLTVTPDQLTPPAQPGGVFLFMSDSA
jgi:hypothetical protein